MNSEIKPVYQRIKDGIWKNCRESEFNQLQVDNVSGFVFVETRILYPAAALEALQTELQITRDANLAVVRRLQAKIDLLEKEAKKDSRYITNMQQETRDNEESWYNCGEL